MGKSTKKSATKVDAAVVAAPPKPLEKGKREAEDAIEKISATVSAKKRKVKKKKKKKAEVVEVGNVEEKRVENSSEAQDEKISEDCRDEDPETKNMEILQEDKEESPEVDAKPSKSPKKNESDTEMTDTVSANTNDGAPDETPKNPDTPKEQSEGQKTLFVGNLSFSIERSDVENFFNVAGEVVDVRFGMYPDNTFKGFGHVEFATAEQAEKALLELNGTDLLGRPVRLDLARERVANTQHSEGKEDAQSFQKGARTQGRTVFIRGFDKNADGDQIKSLLEKNFGSCGEITRISIPKDDECLKGIAYIEFNDDDAFNKAVETNGFDFGEGPLTVEAAKPKRDGPGGRRGGRFGGGRRGGRFGGGRGRR